ncbi:lysylphosphatidylglycerol synthase domain-containing protein [Scytonema sp. NUACC26]|uniref:lysylphosphatidylglycerol synthase domain-containing protein n=1 Tax=Scytonema sp. NUACC26 TaxID=3140176 RepID=UPI0034DC27E8
MLKKLQFNFSSLFSLLLLVVCLWAISNELREYNYHDLFLTLAKIPKQRLSGSIFLTALGYLVMVGYDLLGFSYIGRSLSWTKVAFTNFISSTFSNTIGFALLTGSAVRYRFYSSWGISAFAIAQVIAFANFTFWLGMFAVAGIVFLTNPLKVPSQLHLPFLTVRPVGILFLLLVGVYLLASLFIKQPIRVRLQEFRFPSLRISLTQIIVSSCDWILAAAVLYILLPPNIALSYLDFLGIYLLAMFAGVVSNVPGGLGVFETVILLLLSYRASAVSILGSMLAYRGVYYFLPLLLAGGMLGFYALRHSTKTLSNKSNN